MGETITKRTNSNFTKLHMKLNRISTLQLPSNKSSKKCHSDHDDSPNDTAWTQDGSSDYPTQLIPFNLSFSEKERIYVLVQWKLKKLLASQSDNMNVNCPPVQSALT